MDTDDRTTGQLLSRRQVIALLGAGSLGLVACAPRPRVASTAAGSTGCVVRPEQTEGPYFVDERLHRGDLRLDPSDGSIRPGAPLELTLVVSRLSAGSCTPLAGAQVDLWQCDHLGVYSDVRDPRFDTSGKRFLRGYQLTDAQGRARFTTIYPGWYQGRTVHIHFKIRSPATQTPGYEFTSQFYFDDALSDRVFRTAPYAGRPNRSTRNANDGIYRQGGPELTLVVEQRGEGYASTFQVAMTGV